MPDVYAIRYNLESFQLPANLPCRVGHKVYELAQQHVRDNDKALRAQHQQAAIDYEQRNLLPFDRSNTTTDRNVWVSFTVTVPDPELDIFADLLVGTDA